MKLRLFSSTAVRTLRRFPEDLFESRSPENYRFCGRVIANTRMYCGGLLAVSHITQTEMDELGVGDGDVDGAIGIVRLLAGISAAVFVRETKDGKAKVSLRSKSELNVAEICSKIRRRRTCQSRRMPY